jgi:hypothetical protein
MKRRRKVKEEEEISVEYKFFNNSNFPFVMINIFLYVSDNKTLLNFASMNKKIFSFFKDIMCRINTHYYQYKVLTNDKNRIDYSFDIYNPPSMVNFTLNKELFCTSLKEYETNPYINKSFKNKVIMFNMKVKDVVFETLYKTNTFFGENVAMLSGGRALEQFLKPKNFKIHAKRVGKNFYKNSKLKGHYYFQDRTLGYAKTISRDIPDAKCCTNDYDIFLMGNKKIKTAEYFLSELEKGIENKFRGDIISIIRYRTGLIDIFLKRNTKLNRIHRKKGAKVNKRVPFRMKKWIQIILKKNTVTPNDLFCFVDLDCCKIGWFPRKEKASVVCSIDFIRAITTFKNYAPYKYSMIRDVHKRRAEKYFLKTCIQTILNPLPPLMSYYHNFYFKPAPKYYCKNNLNPSSHMLPPSKSSSVVNKLMKFIIQEFWGDNVAYHNLYDGANNLSGNVLFYMDIDDTKILLSSDQKEHYKKINEYVEFPLDQWKKIKLGEQTLNPYYFNIFGWEYNQEYDDGKTDNRKFVCKRKEPSLIKKLFF